MQEIVYNSCNGRDSLRTPLHLRTASNGDLFNHQSILTSESDDCNSQSEDFNIHFNQMPNQDFGLGYWMKHTNHTRYESPPPRPKSPKSQAFISKSSSFNSTSNKKTNKSDISCNIKREKSKQSKVVKEAKSNVKTKTTKKVSKKEKKSSSSNFNSKKSNYSIPRLKIPKDVVRKYLRTLSPMSSSSSSSSESDSSHNHKSRHKISTSKHKSKYTDQSKSNDFLSDTPLSENNDSSCLQKSFLSSNYSKPQSVYHLSVASHDSMLFSMTIDKNLISHNSGLPVIDYNGSGSSEITDPLQMELADKDTLDMADKFEIDDENRDIIIDNDDTIDIDHSVNENQISLSRNCDNEEKEEEEENDDDSNNMDQQFNDFDSFNHQLTPVNSRKRCFDQDSLDDEDVGVIAKKKMLSVVANCNPKTDDQNLPCDMTVVDYVRLLMGKMKYYEEMVYEKYCLSQPNAMKFLAQNHSSNWESYKNDLGQLHLVPCEFIAEIFHRALHCFGLEKRTLRETMSGDSSPNNRFDTSHSIEYKKVRDEYSFSLKRVRYGIGVIDDLFKRKINFQSTQPNSDVIVVRKWKHLIYYLCLQAKAVFMTKEMQYHNYSNYVSVSGAFDGDCNVLCNTTPTVRYPSIVNGDSNSKLLFTKDSSKLFESKFHKTTPDHFSQFDMDMSPHSYDSGKGSSIRLSSNGNSQVSGCQTTSSLNSTPHSLNEGQLNLPGFHMYRIDEYLKTANEYVQFMPETVQLHGKIISKIGLEPNANSSDNMMRFINYTEVCQQICKQDAMSDCLQRLLSQAVRL